MAAQGALTDDQEKNQDLSHCCGGVDSDRCSAGSYLTQKNQPICD
jgi:hypothetical protein